MEKSTLRLKSKGKNILLLFACWLIAEQILSGNYAKLCLRENGGHFEHFFNISMHIKEKNAFFLIIIAFALIRNSVLSRSAEKQRFQTIITFEN